MRYLVAAPANVSTLEVERLVRPVAAEFRARVLRRQQLAVPAGSVLLEVAPDETHAPLVVVATPGGVRVEVAPAADAWARQRAAGFARRLGELLGDA